MNTYDQPTNQQPTNLRLWNISSGHSSATDCNGLLDPFHVQPLYFALGHYTLLLTYMTGDWRLISQGTVWYSGPMYGIRERNDRAALEE